MRRARSRSDRGAVTAELALGLPLLLVLTITLVWVLSVAGAQVRVVDASREAARALARGDAESLATALARRIAPAGATIQVDREGGEVAVTTRARIGAPGHLDVMGTVVVEATAVALLETEGGSSP